MYVQHVEQFHGLPAYTFSPYTLPEDLPDPDSVAWRLQCVEMGYEYDFLERAKECWARFTEVVELEKVRALIFGYPWYGDDNAGLSEEPLIGLAPRLTGLEALFLGDLTDEEAMISQICVGDVTSVLEAFPGLRELAVRGGYLTFPVTGHKELRLLRVESGGLPREAAAQIAAAELPALEHLELWLGDENYGGDTTIEDLAPLFTGEGKPALRHLGLQNSRFQDELAVALSSAPVVPQLTSLSLSMGIFTDEGARALLSGQPLTHLRELNLSHHFLSHAMMLRIWTELEPRGVRVDLSARQEADEEDLGWGDELGRYVAISE